MRGRWRNADLITRDRPAYRWVIVALSFLAQFAGSGFIFYGFSVVLVPLAHEFAGGNRTPVIGLQFASGVIGMLMSPIIGRWVSEGRSRAVLAGGLAATGLGLALASWADSLLALGLLYGSLIAFGASALMGAGATTMIVNWFDERRGTAFGLANVGASAAGIVVAPAAAALMQQGGWRTTLLGLGLAALLFALVAWALVVHRPPGRPAGGRAAAAGLDSGPRQPRIWLIGLVGGLAIMCSTAFLAHVVSFGRDIGLAPIDAAWLGSIFAAGGVAGKLLFGRMSDRVGVRPSFTLALLGAAAAFVALSTTAAIGAVGGLVFIVAMGVSGALPLTNALIAASFPAPEFGRAAGNIWPIIQAVVLAGPLVASLLFDRTGSYAAPFLFLAAALAAAAAILHLMPRPRDAAARLSARPVEGD